MSQIKFEPSQLNTLVDKLQRYFNDELHTELGQFDAEFLIDFISKEMGNAYYNKGLADAQIVLATKLDDISDAIYQLEQPSDII